MTKIYFLTVPWISCRIMECTKLSTTSEAYRYKCCSDHHLQRCTLLNVQLLCIMLLGRTMLVRLNSWWWNWQEWQADSKYAHGMGSNWCYGRLCKSWVGGFVGSGRTCCKTKVLKNYSSIFTQAASPKWTGMEKPAPASAHTQVQGLHLSWSGSLLQGR